MNTLTIDKTKEWTVDDYLLLGEMKTPCQLINGELIMSPAPTPNHQRVARKIFKILDSANLLGEIFFSPIDLYIDSKNVFQPDLVYLSDSKAHLTKRGIEGPPDLIVEIISPSNSYTDRNQKKDSYLRFGVKEYWIVDPGNETIEIYTPTGGADVPVFFSSKEGEVISSINNAIRFNLRDIF
ncbi:MAG: Uma2 family endonuclease [Bacteroidia bacterium]|nr:Uma2 family endonuclease [Bacteroidia bacterium]